MYKKYGAYHIIKNDFIHMLLKNFDKLIKIQKNEKIMVYRNIMFYDHAILLKINYRST